MYQQKGKLLRTLEVININVGVTLRDNTELQEKSSTSLANTSTRSVIFPGGGDFNSRTDYVTAIASTSSAAKCGSSAASPAILSGGINMRRRCAFLSTRREATKVTRLAQIRNCRERNFELRVYRRFAVALPIRPPSLSPEDRVSLMEDERRIRCELYLLRSRGFDLRLN
ncbi:uncharacterized protein LOC107980662 [Nasonia vitripennis]|uniref:Uncharacterized protein n=1 Tax=Nasonia vitripennis TaxID=7425 RepID=A0A7M7IPD9_NASVI|nr:uncharacterized protein LOC107980662 [Nasonia vitripennis]